MPRHAALAFYASVLVGLESRTTGFLLDKEVVLLRLRALQEQLIFENGLYLSATVTECSIQLGEHRVPHLRLDFFNNPKASMTPDAFKPIIEKMAGHLMRAAGQLLVIIEFSDETVMLEAD